MSLCPNRAFRDSLSEPEFWDYVLLGVKPGDELEQPDSHEPLVPLLDPCPECGSVTACAYDEEGRALIHATDEQEDA